MPNTFTNASRHDVALLQWGKIKPFATRFNKQERETAPI
jgi:hypothetical protein